MKYSYKLVAKFDYNNKKYFIIQIKNKIVYAILKDSYLTIELSEEDLYIFKHVHSFLRIDTKTSVNLGIKKMRNKKFEVFYDPKTSLHYWYEIKDNNRMEATNKDNYMLNYLYNHVPTVIHTELNHKEVNNITNNRNRFIKRIISVGKKVLVVFLLAETSLINLSSCSIANKIQDNDIVSFSTQKEFDEFNSQFKEKYNDEDYENAIVKMDRQSREYNYDEIKNTIENNSNLQNSEKEFLYKLKFMFDENYEYMDLDIILERLSKLKITYVDGKNINEQIAGTYNIVENEIIIYDAKDFESSELDVTLHEILHVFQTYNTGRLTKELSNELTTREVLRRMNEMGLIEDKTIFENELGEYSKYGSGYGTCMRVEYLLANLMTQEEMQDYQFYSNDDVIVNALTRIEEEALGDISKEEIDERAYNLLYAIDSIRTYNENGDIQLVYDEEKYEDIYNQIDYYYIKLNGKSMKESLTADLFRYDKTYPILKISGADYEAVEKTLLDTIDPELNKSYGECKFGWYRYVLPKTYLSDVHPNPIIMFNSPAIVKIEITDELEDIYKQNYENFVQKELQQQEIVDDYELD